MSFNQIPVIVHPMECIYVSSKERARDIVIALCEYDEKQVKLELEEKQRQKVEPKYLAGL